MKHGHCSKLTTQEELAHYTTMLAYDEDLRTFQLPAHWNAHSADTTPLTSHPRIHHAAGDCATKLRRMREWLAG